MKRVYNFSSGPAVLPESVLRRAQSEMLDYNGTGMSVMEMSHRSKAYEEIIYGAESLLRELMGIPENYKVLFLQGGASTQFAAVPLNIGNGSGIVDIIGTGMWTNKAEAEAKKFFIERFRASKWRRTGIIWWNLLDGWPQISDAIVDYYFTKKLAYHFIKRSQNPVCLMFREPENGFLPLYGVNDTTADAEISFTVKNITEDGRLVLEGEALLPADASTRIGELKLKDGEKNFYLIEWQKEGRTHRNHYFTNIIDIDYDAYLKALEKCGFDEFEGF